MIEDTLEIIKSLDWTLITIIIGVCVFIGSFCLLILRIQKHKPSLLRPQKITNPTSDEATTYDWEVIRSLFSNCALLAGGFYMISNVLVYVAFRQWYTDPLGLAAIAAIFGIYLLQSFDKFYRKMMK